MMYGKSCAAGSSAVAASVAATVAFAAGALLTADAVPGKRRTANLCSTVSLEEIARLLAAFAAAIVASIHASFAGSRQSFPVGFWIRLLGECWLIIGFTGF